jgi:hypothetical protein
LSLAVTVGYLASCQAQPVVTTPPSTVNPAAPPQAQSALKYTDPSAQAPKGLSYNTKVVGTVPHGAPVKLEPEYKDGKVVGIKKSNFRVLQETESCPPPLPMIETTVVPYVQNIDDHCTLTTSGYSYYVIFDNSSYLPGAIIYQTWTHWDQVWSCSSGASNSASGEYQKATGEDSCIVPQPSPTPSPSPSPEETPEPPTPEPTVAPTEPPSTPPPTNPPTAPPTEPPTPEPTPTPIPDPTLTLDHAVISPDGDGKEDDSPAHVEATGGWKVEVSGGALTQPLQVAAGSDDGSFTWTGKAGNTILPDGNYTLTLTELGTGKTVQVPAILNTALEIKAKYEAFSPNFDPKTGNGDGRFDYNDITVRCGGKWSITANGTVIKTGEGNTANTTFVWNGKPEVGGKVLPDGKYKLLLTRISDGKTAEVEVILDTSPPVLKQTNVIEIDAQAVENSLSYKDNITYSFKFNAEDEAVGGVSTGLSEDYVSVSADTVSFDLIDTLQKLTPTEYTAKFKVKTSAQELKTLRYSVALRDKAGNESEPQKYSFGAKITPESFQISTTDGVDYGVASVPQRGILATKTLVRDEVFYVKSGLSAIIYPSFKLTTTEPELVTIKHVPVHIKNKTTGRFYRTIPLKFVPNVKATATLRWNGKDNILNLDEYAPEGRYISTIDSSIIPGCVTVRDEEVEFFASDMTCVQIKDWFPPLSPAAFTNNERGAHILHEHILPPTKSTPKAEEERFGKYLNFLSLERPDFTYRSIAQKPKDVTQPYTENLALNYDSKNGWPVTNGLMNSSQFKSVMRIADAVWRITEDDEFDNTARYCPVALPNQEVLWVRAVVKSAPVIYTVYPFKSNIGLTDGQDAYERKLKAKYR